MTDWNMQARYGSSQASIVKVSDVSRKLNSANAFTKDSTPDVVFASAGTNSP